MNDALIARALDAPDLTLGQAIEMLRRPTGMSARALSLSAGLSPSYVGKVEKGEIEPSLRAFACLARTLGLSPREINVLVVREGALAAGAPARTAVPA